jgi:hypothetical protein
MVRKCVVKVVLSKEQREILVELSSRLGTIESETLRMSLMETIHRSKYHIKDAEFKDN